MMIFSSDFYNNFFPTLLLFVKTILLVCLMLTAIQCDQAAPPAESNSDSQAGQSSGKSPEQPSQNSSEQSYMSSIGQPFQNYYQQYFKPVIGQSSNASLTHNPFGPSSYLPDLGEYFSPMHAFGYSYYNPTTGKPLMGTAEGEKTAWGTPKVKFEGVPCACVDFKCGCCIGLNITTLTVNRVLCSNFTFDQTNLIIKVKMTMNDTEVFKGNVSGRNPPPVCSSMSQIPLLDLCLRFNNLTVFPETNNLHTCINFETRFIFSTFLVMQFNCVRINSEGINWLKPADSIGNVSFDPMAPITGVTTALTELYDKINWEISNAMSDDDY